MKLKEVIRMNVVVKILIGLVTQIINFLILYSLYLLFSKIFHLPTSIIMIILIMIGNVIEVNLRLMFKGINILR